MNRGERQSESGLKWVKLEGNFRAYANMILDREKRGEYIAQDLLLAMGISARTLKTYLSVLGELAAPQKANEHGLMVVLGGGDTVNTRPLLQGFIVFGLHSDFGDRQLDYINERDRSLREINSRLEKKGLVLPDYYNKSNWITFAPDYGQVRGNYALSS